MLIHSTNSSIGQFFMHIASFSWNQIFRFSKFFQKKGLSCLRQLKKYSGIFATKLTFQFRIQKRRFQNLSVLSMLLTDVGDEKCWWQLCDVSDSFGHFGHQHPLSFYISVGHRHSKDVANIEILSPKSTNRHQL